MFIGENYIESRRKSFKISRCERLVLVEYLAPKRLQKSQRICVWPEILGVPGYVSRVHFITLGCIHLQYCRRSQGMSK